MLMCALVLMRAATAASALGPGQRLELLEVQGRAKLSPRALRAARAAGAACRYSSRAYLRLPERGLA